MRIAFIQNPRKRGGVLQQEECCHGLSYDLSLPCLLLQAMNEIKDLAEIEWIDCAYMNWNHLDLKEYLENRNFDYAVFVGIEMFTNEAKAMSETIKSAGVKPVLFAFGPKETAYLEGVTQPYKAFSSNWEYKLRRWIKGDREVEGTFKDLHPLDFGLVSNRKYNLARYQLSRGCNYNCSFCIWGMYRKREKKPVDVCIQDLKKMKELGYEAVYLLTDQITSDPEWFDDFFVKYAKEVNLPFRCNARANELNKDNLKVMKDAGMLSIQIGVESLSQRMLDSMHKALSVKDIVNAVKLCKKYDIPITLPFLFGLGETKEDVDETIRIIKTLPKDIIDIRVDVVTVYRDCHLFKENEDYPMMENRRVSVNFEGYMALLKYFACELRKEGYLKGGN